MSYFPFGYDAHGPTPTFIISFEMVSQTLCGKSKLVLPFSRYETVHTHEMYQCLI